MTRPGADAPTGWLVERGIGETRAALVADGRLLALRLLRDADPVQPGALFGARLRERVGPQRARVDLGDALDALIQPCPALPEGALLAVEVSRASLPEPGRYKPAQVRARPDLTPAGPGLIAAAPDLATATCWENLPVRAVARLPEALGVDEALEAGITGAVPFAGGQLWLERTRAGLVIDVDGSGPADALNVAAAAAIAGALRLYDIGGPVMIDFLGSTSRAGRQAVAEAFDAASAADPRPCERTAINGFGLMQVIRARPRASVIDHLCGTRRAAASDETLALALLRAAARAQGVGPCRLVCPPAVAAWLEARPALTQMLARQRGATVSVVAAADASGYGYAHVSPL